MKKQLYMCVGLKTEQSCSLQAKIIRFCDFTLLMGTICQGGSVCSGFCLSVCRQGHLCGWWQAYVLIHNTDMTIMIIIIIILICLELHGPAKKRLGLFSSGCEKAAILSLNCFARLCLVYVLTVQPLYGLLYRLYRGPPLRVGDHRALMMHATTTKQAGRVQEGADRSVCPSCLSSCQWYRVLLRMYIAISGPHFSVAGTWPTSGYLLMELLVCSRQSTP